MSRTPIASSAIGTTLTRVGNYTVPAGKVAVVTGLRLANVGTYPVLAGISVHDGASYTAVVRAQEIKFGQALDPDLAANKIVLPAGGGLFVKSDQTASIDVVAVVEEEAA